MAKTTSPAVSPAVSRWCRRWRRRLRGLTDEASEVPQAASRLVSAIRHPSRSTVRFAIMMLSSSALCPSSSGLVRALWICPVFRATLGNLTVPAEAAPSVTH